MLMLAAAVFLQLLPPSPGSAEVEGSKEEERELVCASCQLSSPVDAGAYQEKTRYRGLLPQAVSRCVLNIASFFLMLVSTRAVPESKVLCLPL